jgi:hypothetical protein
MDSLLAPLSLALRGAALWDRWDCLKQDSINRRKSPSVYEFWKSGGQST